MRKTLGICVVLLFGVAACGGTPSTGDDDGDDTGDDTGDDVSTDPDASNPADHTVRFVAVGDTGKGNDTEYAVGMAMASVCAQEGCDFAILLGDNVYQDGPVSETDQQFTDKFEIPYAGIDTRFYITLGNHDYGGQLIIDAPGIGNEWEKADYEVAYTQHSEKWYLPSTYYTFERENVGFVALDTNSILWGNTDHGDQRAWWPTGLAEVSDKEWVFMVGHHPYRSNGTHGDAGDYDAPELAGFSIPNPLPIQNGAEMQAFFEDLVCGNVDVILTGHDHAREWIDEPTLCGGTEMIVSGAGADPTSLPGTTNNTFYQDASEGGFLYVVIDGNTMTGTFYDQNGNADFTRTITH